MTAFEIKFLDHKARNTGRQPTIYLLPFDKVVVVVCAGRKPRVRKITDDEKYAIIGEVNVSDRVASIAFMNMQTERELDHIFPVKTPP